VLVEHPINKRRVASGKLAANIILTRDAGSSLPKFYSLNEKYNVHFACLADMPVERGIARLAGMNLVDLPPPSGSVRDDMRIRVKKLLENLPRYDCFYIHIKGPDEPGHDGDFYKKMEIIELIDTYFFAEILQNIDLKENVICVTADHATPCELKAHSDDPVPLLISGGDVKPDGSSAFSEKACSKGSLGTISRGTELIPLLMKTIKSVVNFS
ncbi:phosphoglycerate mutase, partial [Candidatus Bathyarchaeota archaeon]